MTVNLGVPEATKLKLKPRIIVLGIGGGGCNALNTMIASNLKGVEFDCYFNCIFDWNFITLGIYPDGTVYTMYSDTGFSSLAKVFGTKEAK
mgnify:CR=1 FL=1